MKKKAVVLLSGGLDSTTCLAIAQEQGFSCYALSFDFGQKHKVEIEKAKEIAKKMNVIEHKILSLPLKELGGSSLVDSNIPVPDYDPENSHIIPTTYVPARNTVFLSIALGWAEVIGAYDIFYGANHIDYSNYSDCRPDYIAMFEKLAKLATKAGVEGATFRIHAPLIQMGKSEIIQAGLRLGLDYSMTVSCYQADQAGGACGTCDSCTYRKKGFREAGLEDPTFYSETKTA